MIDDGELAVAAAGAGAQVLREMYGSELARYGKGCGDFATDADIAAERAIMDVLREGRPADGFVGEESGASGGAAGCRT